MQVTMQRHLTLQAIMHHKDRGHCDVRALPPHSVHTVYKVLDMEEMIRMLLQI